MFWWGLVVRACARGRSCDEMLDDGGAGNDSPAAEGDAGGRRGCQSHVNLQFSCSFFLQGEGIPNGRLCERAGRVDGLDVAWESLDSTMCWDCSRRRNLMGCCCLENYSWDQRLQADGGGFHGSGGFAEILSLPGVAGARTAAAPRARSAVAATAGTV